MKYPNQIPLFFKFPTSINIIVYNNSKATKKHALIVKEENLNMVCGGGDNVTFKLCTIIYQTMEDGYE